MRSVRRSDARTPTLAAVSLHHATLESTADGILVVDLQGRMLSYNRRFLDLWRIPEELTASGRDADLLELVVGQIRDRDAFLARVAQLYASPGGVELRRDPLH